MRPSGRVEREPDSYQAIVREVQQTWLAAEDQYSADGDARKLRGVWADGSTFLRGVGRAIFGTERIANPRSVFDEYQNAIFDNTVEQEVDWKSVDVWRAGRSEDENDFINRRLGVNDTSLKLEYRRALQQVDGHGLFEIATMHGPTCRRSTRSCAGSPPSRITARRR